VLKETDQRIEAILKECERTDQWESEGGSLMTIPEDLAQAESLKDKVQKIAQSLKESSTQVFNTTDPDGRHMQGRQGTHAGYNVQSVVDDKHGLIVHSDVVSDGNDRHQLAVQTEEANKSLGKPCQTVCADAGYDDNKAWKKLEDNSVEVVVKANGQGPSGPLGVQAFLLRGFSGVRAEASMLASCFNIARLMTILGPEALLMKMKAV
jgi:hypothetical protein